MLMLAALGKGEIQLVVTPQLLFSVLALLLAIWLVFTLVIRYHWKNYSTGGAALFTMNFFYLAGSVVFIGLLLFFLLLYLGSTT